ncbi:MAG: hypothetical protein D4R88_09850 [Methanosarcinales archaeon]|nr:MAG: hypothetical protein D4R88_09850 [Methanosarcinales archaeon]
MKIVHILIVLVIAALTLGCIGNKQAEPSTSFPVSPVETSVSPAATIVPGSEDPFGTDMDVEALDSMLADSTMDISLMDSI